ncbi:MAG TPA: zf-HC2 domain-containing protein [Anaerolineae bacterium]|nr:zf-HC2 domain-containing protein [Anaerolineae bacterium]
MEQHVTDRIAAYHDGALTAAQQQRVAAHLANCAACRAELEALEALTTLLHAAPPATTTLSPERFVAQVGLRLPRQPERTVLQQAAEVGWRLIPVGVLGAWTFVQTVLILGTALLIVTTLAGVAGTLSPAMGWLNHVLGYLPDTIATALRGWFQQRVAGSLMVGSVMLLLGIAGLYGSWLASWWLREQRADGRQ